jgi:uncharacterized GH25 family protein
MKRIFLITLLLLNTSLLVFAQENYLLPTKFVLAPGDSLNVRLMTAKSFKDPKELPFTAAKVSDCWILEGSKKVDLKASSVENSLPVVARKLESAGLTLLGLSSAANVRSMPKSRFADYLKEQGLDELAKQFESNKKPFVKERITWFSKTLVKAEKNSRGTYDEKGGQQLEIVLLQNPYKLKYGDDMTAQILMLGKPLKLANVEVLTQALNGSVYTTNYRTDDDGKIYFKVNRTGTWLVRLIQTSTAAADAGADYETFGANFTFGFEGQM